MRTKLIRRWQRIKSKVCTFLNKACLIMEGASVGKHFICRGSLRLYADSGKILIGSRVTINSADWANPIGFMNRTYIQMRGGVLRIGSGSGLSNCAITCAREITIGENVMIGAGCKIYDTDFHPLEARYRIGAAQDQSKTRSAPVAIGDNAFIGAGSIILKGASIGQNSIIGAGSVVTGNIPGHEIWAGNPARFIRKIADSV